MSETMERNGLEPADLDNYFTVFAGSPQEDVSYAKVFWSSVTLQPPLESRLVSGDISQRLKVAGNPQHYVSTGHGPPILDTKCEENLQAAYLKQRADEKKIYLQMAKHRDEVIALLRRQREERIKKEMISLPYKPNKGNVEKSPPPLKLPEDIQQDMEDVRGLD
ncbi:cilia- and flagella-associated protein HOATZ [Conger conger]|uniref:cilia- and flagella-associated protein HOATZ n=1 Tax=Conger conger TaxID=82655 RepID=UPI002A5A6492|nr:cilia- and flagella-associated protein HOATZ [Conger conger]